jgi:hypothetical protein
MATRKRAAPRAQEVKDEPVQHDAPEQENAIPNAAEYVQAALGELEALGARRTYNQMNALSYLKQAQSWLAKDNPKANK